MAGKLEVRLRKGVKEGRVLEKGGKTVGILEIVVAIEKIDMPLQEKEKERDFG